MPMPLWNFNSGISASCSGTTSSPTITAIKSALPLKSIHASA